MAKRGARSIPRGPRAGPDPRVQSLYAVPPAEFTAARDALARALAAEGHPDAARVSRLRRPTVIVWLLNAVARERSDSVAALFAAGDRLRQAQVRAVGGDGAELRAATAALHEGLATLRAAAEELARRGGRGVGAAALDQVERGLRAAATADVAVRTPLRQGVLERLPEPGGVELLAGLAEVPRRDVRAPDARARERARTERPAEVSADARHGDRAGTDGARRARAEGARRDRERRIAVAEAERRERVARAAEQRVRSAERELDAARRRLAETRREAEVARRAAVAARAAADAARGGHVSR